MIKELLTYAEYVTALINFDDYHFSQSAVFLAARLKRNIPVRMFALLDDKGDVLALIQVLNKTVLRSKTMLLLPFGPLVKVGVTQNELRRFLSDIVGQYREVVYLQADLFSMNLEVNETHKNLLFSAKMDSAFSALRHSDGTTVISLAQSPESQFENYRKDVKYNIRRAEKDQQLQIEISRNPDKFDDFWKLYEATQKRKHFNDNRADLYKAFYDQDSAFIIEAKANGEMVAAVFCLEYKEQNTLITFLSSTTYAGNKLKAPTYLRWKILNYAYENKFKAVDLFSVDKELEGHSAFKLGFRGDVIWFNQPIDLVINRLQYNLLKVINRLKSH